MGDYRDRRKALPGHKCTGPYNPLEEQLDANDIPIAGQEPFNAVDAISMKHDICYRDHKDGKKKCDDKMKPGCIEIIGTDKDNSNCGHCNPPIKAGEFVFQCYNLDTNGKLTKYREHFQTR